MPRLSATEHAVASTEVPTGPGDEPPKPCRRRGARYSAQDFVAALVRRSGALSPVAPLGPCSAGPATKALLRPPVCSERRSWVAPWEEPVKSPVNDVPTFSLAELQEDLLERLEALTENAKPEGPTRLGVLGQAEGGSHLDALAGVFKDAIRDVSLRDRARLVEAMYQASGLKNRDGSWADPGLAKHEATLMPDKGGPTFEQLVEDTADASRANNFLLELLGRVLSADERAKMIEVCRSPEAREGLVQHVAYLYLINQVTEAMLADGDALRAVVQIAERVWKTERPLRRAQWPLYQKPFAWAKFVSVLNPVRYVSKCVDEGEPLSESYLKGMLPANICEAKIVDRVMGQRDNARAAAILARAPLSGPSKLTGRGTEHVVTPEEPATYAKVYDLWNRCFMARYCTPRGQAKLMAKAVLGALQGDPATYIPRRSYALLLHLLVSLAHVSREDLNSFQASESWGGLEAEALREAVLDKLGRYNCAIAEQYRDDLAARRAGG